MKQTTQTPSKRYKHTPKRKKKTFKAKPIYPRNEMISRKEYILKNYLPPIIILGIMIILSVCAVIYGEPGSIILTIFTVTSFAVMLFLANRSYNIYCNLFKP